MQNIPDFNEIIENLLKFEYISNYIKNIKNIHKIHHQLNFKKIMTFLIIMRFLRRISCLIEYLPFLENI